MKQLFIHCSSRTTQAALVEDGRLVEFFAERPEERPQVGAVYKGRVVNVLPGMQAAFVDIGEAKNAFLYVDDLLHPHLERQPKIKPSISELVRPGDELVVQVMKEALDGKGARVTTHFSLPGRWLVYMPEADYIGVSKKIEQETERHRLKMLAEDIRRPGEGLILRTSAAGESARTLAADLEALRRLWAQIRERAANVAAPAELHRDMGLVQRMVRDTVTPDTTEVLVDEETACADIRAYLSRTAPALEPRLKLYRDSVPMFERFGITEQLARALQPRIPLPSGGYLVMERTEALTVVDVNTGKFTGADDPEETVFRTNLEAAEEIARLLRLLDVGGIIIVDFIDMRREEHRRQVEARLMETIRRDRTKCQVVGWTRLGLLEMTRKKARENAMSRFLQSCAACGGVGRVPARDWTDG